jgi:hypothetical protein
MKVTKNTKLAASILLAFSLAACGTDSADFNSTTGGTGTGTGTGTGNSASPSASILDSTQIQLGNVVNGLSAQLAPIDANSPLKVSAFIRCLNPTVNQLLDGPDALLTNLLATLQGGVGAGINNASSAFNPALIQQGVIGLAGGVQSLTVTLPNALMALAGQGSCTSNTGPGGNNPLETLTNLATDPSNPLAPLFTALTNAGVPFDGGVVGGPTGTPLDIILAPLTQLAGGAGAPGSVTNLATVVNQLGVGVNTLNGALFQNLVGQTQAIPVVGGLTELLSEALADVAAVLIDLDNPATTNQQLLGTVNHLLTNVTGLFSALPGSSTAVTPIQSAIGALTGGLNTITSPITQLLSMIVVLPGTSAPSGANLPTSWIPVLGGIIDGLVGNITPPNTGSGSGNGSGSSPSPTDALNQIPVIGPILGGILGPLFGLLG